jgi:hypothetical protein
VIATHSDSPYVYLWDASVTADFADSVSLTDTGPKGTPIRADKPLIRYVSLDAGYRRY